MFPLPRRELKANGFAFCLFDPLKQTKILYFCLFHKQYMMFLFVEIKLHTIFTEKIEQDKKLFMKYKVLPQISVGVLSKLLIFVKNITKIAL